MSRVYLLFLLMAVGLHAAGFDCTKAMTPQERAICTSPLLSSEDDQMTAAYKEALAAVPPDVKTRVREDQRQWLSNRDAICPASRDPSTDFAMSDCLSGYENRRAELLRHLIQRKNGILFVWRSATLSFHAMRHPDLGVERDGYSEAGSVLASWPHAISGSPEWQTWNHGIEEVTRRMACGNPENKNVQVTWSPVCAKDAMNTISVAIVSVEEPLVAAEINREWYDRSGGSSGTDSLEFNWLLGENREIRADDIFKARSGWREALLSAAGKSLYEDGKPLFGDRLGDIETKIVLNPENWYLRADALVIGFPSAYAECHACDSPAVTIPWEELKLYLNSSFPRMQESTSEAKPAP